jgi:hypothetical protein
MTQEEIQEQNKQIALMLGWVQSNLSGIWYKKDDTANYVVYSEHNNYPHIGLPFHRDWNWLMEAVQFLHRHFKSKEMYWTGIERYRLYSEIESVFVMISGLAKLYNEKKLYN